MNARIATMPLLLVPMLTFADNRPVGRSFATRSEVLARNGIAATSQPLATQAALEILRQGGSAVDGAIAANAVLGLVEPASCGLGGDLFAIVWDSGTKKLHGLNASGRSPSGLSLDELRKRGLKTIPSDGALPVSAPGCVDGWFELHGKFGRLGMEKVLAPAISYAKDGFPVTEVIADEWANSAGRVAEQPGFKAVFMPEGRAPRAGEVFRNPHLAATLEKIAAGGRDAFYKGGIAEAIAGFMRAHGGFLAEADLAAHESEWVEPVSTNYRGYDIWELPPNTQGIAALQMLNMLEGCDLKAMGFGSAPTFITFSRQKNWRSPTAQNSMPIRLFANCRSRN